MVISEIRQASECDQYCEVCHCSGEGCDGTICHGLDAD